MRGWIPIVADAHSGHVVTPSRAVLSSRVEALDFVAHGLVKPQDHVLDVGAGNGRQAIGLLEMGIASYTGLEVIRESVDFGNRVFAAIPQAQFVHLDVANQMYNASGSIQPEEVEFPFESERFNFVVAGSLYTHLERIEVATRYVQETARVLAPSGRAFMSFFRSPPNELSSSAVRTVFDAQDVLEIVGEHFHIDASEGGRSSDFHDQWRLYLTKREK